MNSKKRKSIILIITTLLSVSVGITSIIQGILGIINVIEKFTTDDATLIVSIVSTMIVFLPLLMLFLIATAIFEIVTACEALKDNNMWSHVANAFTIMILFFAGMFLNATLVENNYIWAIICDCTIWSQILRTFAYFNQKKLEKREENKNEFIR